MRPTPAAVRASLFDFSLRPLLAEVRLVVDFSLWLSIRCQTDLGQQRQTISVTLNMKDATVANFDELASWHFDFTSSSRIISKGTRLGAPSDPSPNEKTIGDRVESHHLKSYVRKGDVEWA